MIYILLWRRRKRLSGIHALQPLGIFPFMIGPFSIHAFGFWSFLMWAMMVWVYVWVTQMLWNMEKSGWLFLAVIATFNLILDFMVMLGQGTWSDVMLPDVRQAFEF